jgi:DNA-directed RNA polymerase specialized sigma24 family protein
MARPLVTTIRYMPEPSNGKEQVLRRLRIGAQGIVAIQQAIDAPLEAQSQGHRQREEQSREQMRAALQDARAVQRKQMSQARESGASDAEIAEAVGMPEKGVRRTLQ